MSNVINVDFKSKKKSKDIIELIEEKTKTDFNEIIKKNKENAVKSKRRH